MPSDTGNGPGPGAKPVDLGSISLILIVLLALASATVWRLADLLRQPTSAAGVLALDSVRVVRAAAPPNTDSVAQPRDSAGAQAAPSPAVDSSAPLRVAADAQPRMVLTAARDSALVAARAEVDARLFLIVILSGALGGLLHAIRSFVWYVGNRELRWSWVPTYLTLPVTSALLAAVMYFVVRAGFLGFQGSGDLNSYGFAAASALIGLFSQSAILKLKEVAETLFTRPPQGADARPEVATKPGAEAAAPSTTKGGALAQDSTEGLAPVPVIIAATIGKQNGKRVLTIDGNGFRMQSEVRVNTRKVAAEVTPPKRIVAVVPDEYAAAELLRVQIVTPPPGGGESVIVNVVRPEKTGGGGG